jgi:LAGLIDADG DNA endonuclease family
MLNEFYFSFFLSPYLSKGKKNSVVKIVPLDLSLLTPLALAQWVMQDGSRVTSKGLYLCTDSFTHDDVKRLSQYLINKYNIKCSIHKAGKTIEFIF